MRKKSLTIIGILIILQNLYAQKNWIKNPSFEELFREPTLYCPSNIKDNSIQLAKFWVDFGSQIELFGPNFTRSVCKNCDNNYSYGVDGYYAPNISLLLEGNHYIKLNTGYGESVSGNLLRNIPKNYLVRFSADLAVSVINEEPFNFCNFDGYDSYFKTTHGTLRLQLTNKELKASGNNDYCKETNKHTIFQQSFDYSPSYLGNNLFTKVYFMPLINHHGQIKSFTIGGRNFANKSDCVNPQHGIIFIDNVSIEAYDMVSCGGPCTQNLILGNIPNVVTPNNDGFNDFFRISVLNMTHYDLLIYDRWGNKVHDVKDHIPYIGSSSAPYVVWNATDKRGNLVVNGQYFYRLTAKNCLNKQTKTGSFTVLGNQVSPYPNSYYFDPGYWACCTPDYYLQNEFYESGITYEAAHSITAVNVTANAMTVVFQAGNEIVLGDNFVAEHGKEFVAFIADCIPGSIINYGKNIVFANTINHFGDSFDILKPDLQYDKSPFDLDENITINLDEKLYIDNLDTNFFVIVYPNPCVDSLIIESNVSCNVKIYDILGRMIYNDVIQNYKKI